MKNPRIRNLYKDLTEAEDIKKRWQEHIEELYKKHLHDPDNHDGVISHLKPDILKCEVKWALGSITMNKASVLMPFRNELPVQVRCRIQEAWGWCTGMTQRDGMGREVGGGFRMGNTCTPVADSC